MSEAAVHNRLRQLRIERGVSRRELAEALGVHYQTVGYLERGEYSPSLELALRIAQHFDVPVELIFSLAPFPRIGDEERTARPIPVGHHGQGPTDGRGLAPARGREPA